MDGSGVPATAAARVGGAAPYAIAPRRVGKYGRNNGPERSDGIGRNIAIAIAIAMQRQHFSARRRPASTCGCCWHVRSFMIDVTPSLAPQVSGVKLRAVAVSATALQWRSAPSARRQGRRAAASRVHKLGGSGLVCRIAILLARHCR